MALSILCTIFLLGHYVHYIPSFIFSGWHRAYVCKTPGVSSFAIWTKDSLQNARIRPQGRQACVHLLKCL